MDTLNIFLLDKHQFFREGVKQVLSTESSFRIIAGSDDYSVLQSTIDVYEVDVVLMDVHMFIENEQHIQNLIKASINGYLLKNMDIYSFIDAIKFVSTGNDYIHYSASNHLVKAYRQLIKKEEEVTIPLHLFTKRECEVLQLLTDGQSNRKIAE